MTKRNIFFAKEFFEKRFGRKPEQDEEYFEEWAKRFNLGHPEIFMDSESISVYRKMLKNRDELKDLISEKLVRIRRNEKNR